MLPRKNRLNLKKDRFFKGDRDFSCSSFKILSKKAHSQEIKIGFIVSSKIGNATSRNKVKRILSEAAAKNLKKIPRGIFLIIIAFPKAAKASYQEIDSSIKEGISKICVE